MITKRSNIIITKITVLGTLPVGTQLVITTHRLWVETTNINYIINFILRLSKGPKFSHLPRPLALGLYLIINVYTTIMHVSHKYTYIYVLHIYAHTPYTTYVYIYYYYLVSVYG